MIGVQFCRQENKRTELVGHSRPVHAVTDLHNPTSSSSAEWPSSRYDGL
jgi:hypothetical protein